MKDLLEHFLRLIRFSSVFHINEVRIVFALFLIGERRIIADAIVANLEMIYILIQIDDTSQPGTL